MKTKITELGATIRVGVARKSIGMGCQLGASRW